MLKVRLNLSMEILSCKCLAVKDKVAEYMYSVYLTCLVLDNQFYIVLIKVRTRQSIY